MSLLLVSPPLPTSPSPHLPLSLIPLHLFFWSLPLSFLPLPPTLHLSQPVTHPPSPTCPPSSLLVALLTEEGDADLYASTVAEKPDFRDLSSCLCGLDLIVIATSKGAGTHEKVYLSVVGHGRHEVSRYRLFIIAPTKNDIAKYQVCVCVCVHAHIHTRLAWLVLHSILTCRYGTGTLRVGRRYC